MSDYPAGARNDSRAPYNESENFCPNCQEDEINEHVYQYCLDDDCEDEIERLMTIGTLCDDCLADQRADEGRDDR